MAHTKTFIFILILLMQACGPLLAQTEHTKEPGSSGILQRLVERVRAAKGKIQQFGELARDIAGAYYEDHVQPVKDSYVEWASDVKTSLWETIQTAIDSYTPFNTTQLY